MLQTSHTLYLVSDRLCFRPKWPICQVYYVDNQLHVDDNDDYVHFTLYQ